MRPAADSPLPAMVGTVGIAPTPSRLQRVVQTDYTTFPNNWQVLRDSHPPGRFWRPARPLGHLGPKAVEWPCHRSPRGVRVNGRRAKATEGILRFRCTTAKDGGAGRLRSVSSALQVRRAAIITTAPKWTRRRDLHPRTSALQAGPLAARARRDGK